jgi:hypothetical protein
VRDDVAGLPIAGSVRLCGEGIGASVGFRGWAKLLDYAASDPGTSSSPGDQAWSRGEGGLSTVGRDGAGLVRGRAAFRGETHLLSLLSSIKPVRRWRTHRWPVCAIAEIIGGPSFKLLASFMP